MPRQSRHVLSANLDFYRGAVEIVANLFEAASEMLGQERLADGEEGEVVFRAPKKAPIIQPGPSSGDSWYL